jgi:hypothetical protein
MFVTHSKIKIIFCEQYDKYNNIINKKFFLLHIPKLSN